MPNWCYNKVTIRANAATRAKIREFLKGKTYYRNFTPDPNTIMPLLSRDTIFSFHNVIPQPDHMLDREDPRRKTSVPQEEGEGWYDVSFVETKVSMTYAFDTAWAPVSPVIQELSRMFPTAHITLTYREEGMGFKGTETYKGGEILTDNHVEIY